MDDSRDYFNRAVGNFMHEMSGAGAIRHMADQGYSVRQIMERLDYPTPQRRVEETVLKHMLKQGILLEQLPDVKYRRIDIPYPWDRKQLSEAVYLRKEQNGEECSYVLLPIADLKKDSGLLSCLNDREREYLDGLPWEGDAVYHRLTGRMYEIAVELSMAVLNKMTGADNRDRGLAGLTEMRFYFIKSREEVAARRRL